MWAKLEYHHMGPWDRLELSKTDSIGELRVNVVWKDNLNAPCCFSKSGLV